jgi:hypothetical protein
LSTGLAATGFNMLAAIVAGMSLILLGTGLTRALRRAPVES